MWIRKLWKSHPEEEPRSPFDFHPRSNGEFMPWDPTAREIRSEALFHRLSAEKARKLGISRRQFLESSCGLATALVVMNQVMGCRLYDVGEDHTLDPALAKEALSPPRFIFDGHTHPSNLRDIESYVRAIFINSATTMSVITVGQGAGTGPDDTQGWAEHVAIRELVNRISGGRRVLIQGKVWPKRRGSNATDQGQLALMETMAELWKVSAWKAYPHEADNWAMDDERYGIPFIEKGRQLGIRIFAVHKGLGSASPVDMPVVAKRYPDCRFIVFHAGVDFDRAEQAFDPARTWGMDRLIASWESNGKPGNLYADLGSIWNLQSGMNATAAGHMIGKLLKHLGEDNICWGTDALVVGQPAPQIASFSAFQIPQALQDQHQYPALTPAIKDKILGGNLARIHGVDPSAALKAVSEDELTKMRGLVEAGEMPYRPHFGYGPRTRREFLAMLRDPSHPARG
jgi:predicted TIM-barrel fold metal-dependent hydrolase